MISTTYRSREDIGCAEGCCHTCSFNRNHDKNSCKSCKPWDGRPKRHDHSNIYCVLMGKEYEEYCSYFTTNEYTRSIIESNWKRITKRITGTILITMFFLVIATTLLILGIAMGCTLAPAYLVLFSIALIISSCVWLMRDEPFINTLKCVFKETDIFEPVRTLITYDLWDLIAKLYKNWCHTKYISIKEGIIDYHNYLIRNKNDMNPSLKSKPENKKQ